MSGAGGKGHAPRPIAVDADTYADNWERTFGRKQDQALVESMRAENLSNAQMGNSSIGRAAGSNPVVASMPCPGSLPGSPAIYVDDDSGQAVTEAWWPGDPLPERE